MIEIELIDGSHVLLSVDMFYLLRQGHDGNAVVITRSGEYLHTREDYSDLRDELLSWED